MQIKTSDSYKKEVLKKYKQNKGGEVSTYLFNPTPRRIKQACMVLLYKRASVDDTNILNCFFQFSGKDCRLKEIKNFDNDRFKPIVHFLKGKTNNTSDENVELISWLIDFNPRPLRRYLRADNLVLEVDDVEANLVPELEKLNKLYMEKLERKRMVEFKKLEETKRKEKKKGRRRGIKISISVAF